MRIDRRRRYLEGLQGWDLLPAARRLWSRRLDDCRQQTIETEVGGRARGAGDIEGHLIPQAYFSFVRQGRLGVMRNVLEHNRRDMTGMAMMLKAVHERARLLGRAPPPQPLPWQDAWSLARLCESAGDRAQEAVWAEAALAGAPLGDEAVEVPQ